MILTRYCCFHLIFFRPEDYLLQDSMAMEEEISTLVYEFYYSVCIFRVFVFKYQALILQKYRRNPCCGQDRREVFEAHGQNFKIRPLVSVIKASRRGQKQGNLGEQNLEALLEPCRLLLLGGSLNTSKEASNISFYIS